MVRPRGPGLGMRRAPSERPPGPRAVAGELGLFRHPFPRRHSLSQLCLQAGFRGRSGSPQGGRQQAGPPWLGAIPGSPPAAAPSRAVPVAPLAARPPRAGEGPERPSKYRSLIRPPAAPSGQRRRRPARNTPGPWCPWGARLLPGLVCTGSSVKLRVSLPVSAFPRRGPGSPGRDRRWRWPGRGEGPQLSPFPSLLLSSPGSAF